MALIKREDAERVIDNCIGGSFPIGYRSLSMLCHSRLKTDCPVVEAIPLEKLVLFLDDQEIWPNKPDCENCECYHATCDRVTCWEYVLRGLIKQED